jgi:plastocyanin
MRALGKFALAAAVVLATATASLAADATIVLDKMQFGTLPANLHVGDTLIWQNPDILRHSATARDKSFDLDLPPGAEVRVVLKTAGNVDFFCKFHPSMTGTLVVAP